MTIEAPEYLDDDSRAAALALQAAARDADGTEPFGEQTTLRWRPAVRPLDGEWHLLARDGTTGLVAGYGYRDPGGTAEFAVHPEHRRQGHGRALLDALADVDTTPLEVWSHGDQQAARELARAAGYSRVRELLQLRRDLAEDPAPDGVTLPAGVTLRAFEPGPDDDAWVALNAAAFASHPEQGAWTVADLDDRKTQAWFDPAGFLVAERDGELIGFHWTKVHEDGVGEVFVLGVAPGQQGGGLGTALTLAGLHHLFTRGVPAVSLYVEADNAPALKVYERLEFHRWHADVMYAPLVTAGPISPARQ